MPWIRVIDETEASGQLKEIYGKIKHKRGKIANIMKIHSLNPCSMTNHMDLYYTVMFGPSDLRREERELIGVVVSAANNCEYCVNHHAKALNYYWKDEGKVQKLIKDFSSLDLPQRIRRMLGYAVKLAKTPYAINQDDVSTLRECGFSDKDILDVNLITSYFCFVNRIALGLGVEFSADEVEGYKY